MSISLLFILLLYCIYWVQDKAMLPIIHTKNFGRIDSVSRIEEPVLKFGQASILGKREILLSFAYVE